MTIRSLSDINAAFDAGQFHIQRFTKNAGTAHGLHWADCSFATGQPGYDARVAAPTTFFPCTAAGNDAIWFPGIAANHERYLHSATMWSNQATYNGPGSVLFFDLLGYYPLIDGDSTDLQTMTNTLSLPRYSDGVGVQAVVVCHVSAPLTDGVLTVNLTNSDDVAKSVTIGVPNYGVNLVCSGVNSAATVGLGSVGIPLGNGSRGIKRIDSVQFGTAPSGLFCIYLIRQLATMTLGDNLVAAEKEFFLRDGFRLPRVYDGAWLGWFDCIGSGTSRTVAWFGNLTFVWG